MIVTSSSIFPVAYRIGNVEVFVPMGVLVASHLLWPFALNPWFLSFSVGHVLDTPLTPVLISTTHIDHCTHAFSSYSSLDNIIMDCVNYEPPSPSCCRRITLSGKSPI